MKLLRVLIEGSALVLVPLMIAIGFFGFGQSSALSLGLSTEINADYLAGLITAFFILAVIQLLPLSREHKHALTLLWVMRCGYTLGASLFYESYYVLDQGSYFFWGQRIDSVWRNLEFGDGTQNMRAFVRFLINIHLSYTMCKVIFSFIGLVAVYIFYRSVLLVTNTDRIAILYILGMFPSVIFWSSILGKDPITLLGISIYSYGVVGIFAKKDFRFLTFVVLGLLIAMSIRIWLGVIFAVPLVAAYVLTGKSSLLIKIGFSLCAIAGLFWAMGQFSEKFSIQTADDLVQTTDHLSQSWSRGGSAQKIEGGFTSIGSMVAFLPMGMFTALFRPMPGEVLNPFGMLAGIENAALLFMVVMGCYRGGFSWMTKPIMLWLALSLLCWAAIYGYVSFQNLGSAFRFRVQVTPMLLFLAIYLIAGERWKRGLNLG